ncbi:MAG: hypothetical protein AB7O38_07220 [Pirellulaceae bacterium]
MAANQSISRSNDIRQRVRDTQASWTTSERQRRLEEGRRRRAELYSLIAATDPDEVWAVGAPVVADCCRFCVS